MGLENSLWESGQQAEDAKGTGISPGAGQGTGGTGPQGLGRMPAVMTEVLARADSRASWNT